MKVSVKHESISIHSLRGEGDAVVGVFGSWVCHFNPLPPWGGRQNIVFGNVNEGTISIHSLRGEGDCSGHGIMKSGHVFQSTPSVGRETIKTWIPMSATSTFQSTPSVGRETEPELLAIIFKEISIHSLRGEGDLNIAMINRLRKPFQSTPSVGRETRSAAHINTTTAQFQSTPSVGRET